MLTEKRKEAYQERLNKVYQHNLDPEEVCLIQNQVWFSGSKNATSEDILANAP